MSPSAHKPFFIILVIRPPQEDCDLHPSEDEHNGDNNPEIASEENFSREEPLLEKESVTPEPHKENSLSECQPASGSPVVNNNPLNWVDPLGLGKEEESAGGKYPNLLESFKKFLEDASEV